ncbi:hypothetical protein DSL72_008437 [Monilinia vaccinii-corymbosi]|uniref:Uncharacterized protein n=1 Tax=Monilinia vaccinii-corymbosi TaxID=61207 RepID=A0A8A3PJK8_9HELO|nr:hypothetical protein DSL72_008437 [Monilinia vaccinii-corymbosi]
MGKASSKMNNFSEDYINPNVLEHLHRLQQTEEGLSGQSLCKAHISQQMAQEVQRTHKNQQIECQIPLHIPQGVCRELSRSSQFHDPVLKYVECFISSDPGQPRDSKSIQNMKDGVDGIEPGNSINATSIADPRIRAPAFDKPLKCPRKRKFDPCPCNAYKTLHPLHPMDCGVLEYALTGKTKKQIKALPSETQCSSIRERLENPEHKKLKQNCLIVGWIKKTPGDPSSSREYVHFSHRAKKAVNDVADDLIHVPSLYEHRSGSVGIGDSEALIDPPERDLYNCSLPDGIKSISLEPSLAPFKIDVNLSEEKSTISKSIETEPYYDSLSSQNFDRTSGKESTDHSKLKREFGLIESSRTDEGCHKYSGEYLYPDNDRLTDLQSRHIYLPVIQEKEEEEVYDLEHNALGTSLKSCQFDLGDYWDDKLLHDDSAFSLSYYEIDDSPDDKLEFIESHCALLAPPGTRRSSTDLPEEKEISARDLAEQLARLERETEKRSPWGKVMGFLNCRRQNWRKNAEFYESNCSNAETKSNTSVAKIKRSFNIGPKGFRTNLSKTKGKA